MALSKLKTFAAIALTLFAIPIGVLCNAQGILIANQIVTPEMMPRSGPIRPGPMPFPLPRPINIQPFYVTDLKVTTSINDVIAETTVEQTFVNSASIALEATYLYPLPAGANPTGFTMTVDDKTMEPRILKKEEASSIFEGYVRKFRDPALLEYVGRDLVKMSIFPVPAQGRRTIRMRYTEILKPENGVHKYVYSLSTSRFASRPVGVASINIKLNTSSPIKNIYSPSHDLSIRHPEDNRASASWESVNEISDKDLTLYFSTGNDVIGLSMLTYKSGDKDGYFMLLAAPRVTVPKDKVLPKKIVFVLDRTGSMAGPKIEQARKSLLYCLNSLHSTDSFDVITFNESPDVLFRSLVPATEANLDKARRFVSNIEAAGGTNIDEALRSASSLIKSESGSSKMIVFMTDGLPTVGETNVDTILNHFKEWNIPVAGNTDSIRAMNSPIRLASAVHAPAMNPARLFCFGLGYDVNVPFLDRLSDIGHGDSDYIKPQEDVEARVSSFFAKVASPVLSNISVAFDGNGMDVYDVYPKTLPDMFKGSQLVITGRFRGNGVSTAKLTGTANGLDEQFKLTTHAGEAEGANTYLPRIWAQRKLGYLIDQVRLSDNPGGKTELLDEIVRLSKEYGVITEYTSFLVDEPEQRRLGIMRGASDGDFTKLDSNASILRREVALRAVQNGPTGERVTDQSGRAKDLKSSDKAVSRYQSANGSVAYNDYGFGASGGPGGAPAGAATSGNYKYQQAGGGLGGRGGGSGGLSARPSASRMEQLNDQGNAITMQNVDGRTFYLQANKVWQDDKYTPGKQTMLHVKAFSQAHFDLLKHVPHMGSYSSVGESVLVQLKGCAVEIGADGKSELSDADIKLVTGR